MSGRECVVLVGEVAKTELPSLRTVLLDLLRTVLLDLAKLLP